MKISAKTKAKPSPVTVEYAVPEDLDELVKLFGKPVVAAHAGGSIVISAQAFMRRLIAKGKTPQQIQDEIKPWKPDVRSAVKQSAFEKATAALNKLSPEERAAVLKEAQAKAAQPAKPTLKSA